MRVLVVAEGAHELGGALQTLAARLTTQPVEFETKQISNQQLHAHHGKGSGFFKRAVRWLIQAQNDGFDALILVVDEDHAPDRIREIENAQKQELGVLRRALGIAIHTFDAWMLADEKAIGAALNTSIDCQPAPETLSDAKACFKNLRDKSACRKGIPELYAAIATNLNIRLLEDRCPKGFGTFATRVRNI